MTPDQAQTLRRLLESQRTASLGTLHEGEPYVSMVPFALLRDTPDFVIHVSQLSPHTKDMLQHPRVSLLVVASDTANTPPQALTRVTIQGTAERPSPSSPEHAAAREAYLTRFPQAAAMAELPDFFFFAIRPVSARFIGGFAQALSLGPETLKAALNDS
jgi:putative heme iron utilization protein